MSRFFETLGQRLDTAAGHLRLTSVLSWPVFAAIVLGSPLNLSFLLDDLFDDKVLLRLGIITASALVLFVPLWAISRRNDRGQRAEPGFIIVSVVVLSALRTVLLTSALAATGAPRAQWSDMVGLTVTSSVSVLVLTILVDSVREEVARVKRIRALQAAIDQTRTQTAEALRAERAATIEEVTSAVTAVVDCLPETPREEAVSELREVAFGVVRPMSHRLVATMPDVEAPAGSVLEYRINLPEVATDATRAGRLPINWMAVAAVLIPSGYSLVTDRAGLGLGQAVVAAAAQWVVGAVLNRLFAAKIARWHPTPRAIALTVELALTGVAFAAVAVALFFPPERAVRSAIITVISAVVVGWVLLWATSVGRRHDVTAVETEAAQRQLQWEVARANSELRAQRRNIARLLHGPVQATVNAAAIRLDRAQGEKIDPDLAVSVQASIREALVNLLAGNYQERDPAVAIQRIQGTWAGLCDIAVDDAQGVLGLLQRDEPCASAAIDIVTEACSDAVRHGRARHVRVALRRTDNVVELVVVDDGVTDESAGAPGLGSAFLDAVTIAWDRRAGSDGTTLTAVVPFEPT